MSLAGRQLSSLNVLIAEIAEQNAFYSAKLDQADGKNGFESLENFSTRMPFTTKKELAEDHANNPPYGSNLSYPVSQYTRLHQTSGTSGRPLPWLDTPEGWQWVLDNWKAIWQECGAKAGECAAFPFSFGPFLGFWVAFEAGVQIGLRCVPLGGQSSLERLKMIERYQPKWLCCTPTYALHLITVAEREGIDLSSTSVECLIVGGEPGGSVPEVRQRIESGLGNARLFDHHGMTEVGPVTYSDKEDGNLLRILHDAYFCEIIDPETGQAVAEGEVGELVLTALGRAGSPLLRYRTGDLVKAKSLPGEDPLAFALEGGILGRADDMLIVRGVNLYPSAVDAVVRSIDGIGEYQVQIETKESMTEVSLTIECVSGDNSKRISQDLQKRLREVFSLRIPVTMVETGTLPQFEMKAKRWKILK